MTALRVRGHESGSDLCLFELDRDTAARLAVEFARLGRSVTIDYEDEDDAQDDS